MPLPIGEKRAVQVARELGHHFCGYRERVGVGRTRRGPLFATHSDPVSAKVFAQSSTGVADPARGDLGVVDIESGVTTHQKSSLPAYEVGSGGVLTSVVVNRFVSRRRWCCRMPAEPANSRSPRSRCRQPARGAGGESGVEIALGSSSRLSVIEGLRPSIVRFADTAFAPEVRNEYPVVRPAVGVQVAV